MKLLHSISIVVLSAMLLAVGCTESEDDDIDLDNDETMSSAEGQMGQDMMDNNSATVTLSPTEGNNVEGTVTFTKTGDGVRVEGSFSGLSAGMHGFHIHQNGDCSAADGSSAGGHFNPAGNQHAARTDSVRHMGDMGNIEAGTNGNATVNFTDSIIKLDQIIDRAVIIHGGEDDLTSQPSGAAGPRMACGVIESAQSDGMMNDDGSMENDNM